MSANLHIDPSKEQEFKTLQLEGKNLAAEGKLAESLRKFELAKLIYPTPKVLQRIEKLKEHMKSFGLPVTPDENASTSEVIYDGYSSEKIQGAAKSSLASSTRKNSTTKVLSDIQNIQEPKVSVTSDLSPLGKYSFSELKRIAKEHAYEDRFEEARNCFKRALKLYDCPKVKGYIKQIESEIARRKIEEKETSACKAPSEVKKSRTLYSESSVTSKFPSVGSVSDTASNHSSSNSSKYDNTTNEALSKSTKCDSSLPNKSSQSSTSSETAANISDETDKMDQVKELYYDARDLASGGQLVEALNLLKKAQDIQYTQKVQKQINKLEEHLSTVDTEQEKDEMIKIADDFFVFHEIYNKLYPYQREGVAWMWQKYKMRKGGVLGDDMGLGKTFQVIAFLSGMIDSDRIKHVLIIMPVSLITTWEKEFKKWCPGISVHCFHGGSKKERERNLLRVQKRGHVLLTSYGMLVSNVDSLVHCEGPRFIWDYVILDEGHKIKNPTKTTKAVHEISSKNRLILTGTPIQNNLRELWSLYDFVHHGTLLGSLKTFKMQYENPITRSREKDATIGEKRLGTEIAENLKLLIKPYFLRRTKDEIWGKKSDCIDDIANQMGKLKLTVRKNDLILWTLMTAPQIESYTSFLHSDAVKSTLMSSRSPLVQLTILKKICDHPRLLSKRACLQLGLDGQIADEELMEELDECNMASSIDNVSDERLLQESGKLNLVITLLEHLRANGHRTLVFSLSRKILDMIQRILANKNWRVMRLDGTITKREERESRIQTFQNDSRYPVFLITTQVGGVGITLTAADRVIIYDPSWNPATDAQAVDRVYRIGQEKNVIVYRLITCGTVEEKIYRRQIFKDSITRQTTTSSGSADPYRYFSKQELRELFSLDDAYTSKTQEQLSDLHSDQRDTDDMLEDHITYLKSLNIYGISDHDLMFSKEIHDPTEDNDERGVCSDYIKRQVATAEELIKQETFVVAGSLEASGAYYRPYQENVPLSKKNYAKDAYKPPIMPEVIDITEDAPNVNCKLPTSAPDVINLEEEKLPTALENYETIHIESFSGTPKKNQLSNSLSKENISMSKDKIIEQFPSLNQKASVPSEKAFSQIDNDPNNTKNLCEVENYCKKLLLQSSIDSTVEFSPKKDESLSSPHEKKGLSPKYSFTNAIQNSLLRTEKFCDTNEKDLPAISSAIAIEKSYQQEVDDLSGIFDDDLSPIEDKNKRTDRKNRRQSCARKSIFISDSETSEQGSCPPSLNNSAAQLVEESDEDSEVSDSSNRSSVYCIPDSVPSTPKINGKSGDRNALHSTPVKSEGISFINQNDSVRRITPLKVDKSMAQPDLSFAKALAASPMLYHPDSSARNESTVEDTPIKFCRKKRKKTNRLNSDSEESDHDSSSKVETTQRKTHRKPARGISDSDAEVEEKNKGTVKKTGPPLTSDSDNGSSSKGSSPSGTPNKKPVYINLEESDDEIRNKNGKTAENKGILNSDSEESVTENSVETECTPPKLDRKKPSHFDSEDDNVSKDGLYKRKKCASVKQDVVEPVDDPGSFLSSRSDDVFEEEADESYATSKHSSALLSGQESSESEYDDANSSNSNLDYYD